MISEKQQKDDNQSPTLKLIEAGWLLPSISIGTEKYLGEATELRTSVITYPSIVTVQMESKVWSGPLQQLILMSEQDNN